MDPRRSAQDVLRCHLCETPSPYLYCDICHIHLCEGCEGEHLLKKSTEHKVVPFKKRGIIPYCSLHSTNISVLHCEQCDIPVCATCASSKEHHGHKFIEVLKHLENKKRVIQRDLQELEKSFYPAYQEIASNIPVQKADLNKNTEKITTSIGKHGEYLHRKIESIIKKLKCKLTDNDSKHLDVLNKQEDEIESTISEIIQITADLKKLLNSNDGSLVSAYKSRNVKFRKLPPKLTVSFPSFTPRKINKDQLYDQFGSLSELSINTEERCYTVDSPGAESSNKDRLFIDEPRIITDINTEYGKNKLRSVSCQSDDDIWTCDYSDNIMRLYNLQGELVKSIRTKSGNMPWGIASTMSGDPIYADYSDSTVNILKHSDIQSVVKLQGWGPCGVCSTSFLFWRLSGYHEQ